MINIAEYRIVEGERYIFETEVNELTKQGWTWCNNLTTIQLDTGEIWYSILMMGYPQGYSSPDTTG